MKISVKAKTNAREDSVEETAENEFLVKTTELPLNGRANLAIIELLAKYFATAKSNIQIVSGFSSKYKILDVNMD